MDTQVALVSSTGKLADIAPVPACKDYVAAKLGLTLPASTKEAPVTMKTVKEMAELSGHTPAEVKVLVKEFDGLRVQHFADSAVFLAAACANPQFCKSMKSAKNKTGEVVGWNARIRVERSKSVSKDSEIAQLKAQIAALMNVKTLAA